MVPFYGTNVRPTHLLQQVKLCSFTVVLTGGFHYPAATLSLFIRALHRSIVCPFTPIFVQQHRPTSSSINQSINRLTRPINNQSFTYTKQSKQHPHLTTTTISTPTTRGPPSPLDKFTIIHPPHFTPISYGRPSLRIGASSI